MHTKKHIIQLLNQNKIGIDFIPIDMLFSDVKINEPQFEINEKHEIYIKKYNHKHFLTVSSHRPISKLLDPKYFIRKK